MADRQRTTGSESERSVADFVFAGFNRRVIAIDRYTGEIVWTWKAPQGTGYASILLDGDRLVVMVNGYAYCLDPLFGQEVWRNPLKGLGTGVACIASTRGSTPPDLAALAEAARQRAAAAAAAAG